MATNSYGRKYFWPQIAMATNTFGRLTATAKMSWKLSNYKNGSEFVRYANPIGTEGNPVCNYGIP